MARNVDPLALHPYFRAIVMELDNRIAREGIPLRPYEGARSPFRQAELYARGRAAGYGVPGKTVTRAQAWESLHQYGFARDYVFHIGGRWTWNEPENGMWQRFQALAHDLDLQTLSWEKPHVQYPIRFADLRLGNFPPGDDPWLNWLEDQIETWGVDQRTVAGLVHPGAPPLPSIFERPEEVA